MIAENSVLILFYTIIFLFGVSVGRSVLYLKIRKEENKRKALELEILSKRNEMLKNSSAITGNIEELLFRARVQQEINNITRNDSKQ